MRRIAVGLLVLLLPLLIAATFPAGIYNSTNKASSCSVDADCGVGAEAKCSGGTCLWKDTKMFNVSEEVEAVETQLQPNLQGVLKPTSLDTSAKLATLLGDETGSGLAVFGTGPTLAGPVFTSYVVASLPAAGTRTGAIYIVTDSLTGTCQTGGGLAALPIFCRDTGSAYQVVGGGGSGGTAGADKVYVNGVTMNDADFISSSTVGVARFAGGGASGADRAIPAVIAGSLDTTHLAAAAKTGNLTKLATSGGGYGANTCAVWDSSGNLGSTGLACGVGAGTSFTLAKATGAGTALGDGGTCAVSTLKMHQALFDVFDEGGGVGRVETKRTGGGGLHVSATVAGGSDWKLGAWSQGNLSWLDDMRITKWASGLPEMALGHSVRQQATSYYTVPRYWTPGTHYDVNDQVQFFPGGHSKYVAIGTGTSGADVPWASASNVDGVPRVRTPHTQYKTGDRVTTLAGQWKPYGSSGYYGPMRYRVSGGTEVCGGVYAGTGSDCCTTGTSRIEDLVWCSTNACTVTDGACTFTCSDGSCVVPNAANSIVDGTVTWQHVLPPLGGYSEFFGLWSLGGNNGVEPINMEDEYFGQHGNVGGLTDNQRGAVMGDLGQAGRGSYNTNYNIPQQNVRLATFDESPRGFTPSVILSSSHDYPGVRTLAMLRAQSSDQGSGAPRIDQPQFGPLLRPGTGTNPLGAGCYWFAFSWESALDGGRTPAGYFNPIHLNGTTQTGIDIDIPAACPANAANAVLWYGPGDPSGQCTYRRPNFMFRTRTIACAALVSGLNDANGKGNDVVGWDADDNFGETEVPFSVNLTSPVYWEAHALPGAPARWVASQVNTLAGTNGPVIMPTANQQNGFMYALQIANGIENPQNPPTFAAATCTSASTEPVWNNSPGGLTTDGTCQWKWAGREPAMQIWKSSFEFQPQDTWQLREGSNGANGDRVIAGIDNSGDMYWTKYTSGTENRYQSQKSLILHRALTNGGGIDFGPGGYNTPPDVALYRSGANQLKVQQPGGGAAGLVVGDLTIAGTCTGCTGASGGDNISVAGAAAADANFVAGGGITITLNTAATPDDITIAVGNDQITPDMIKTGGTVGQCPFKASSGAMGWQACAGGLTASNGVGNRIATFSTSSNVNGSADFTWNDNSSTGKTLQLARDNTTAANAAVLMFSRSRGGGGNPTTGDLMGQVRFYDQFQATAGAWISDYATEPWSATAAGSELQLWATASATTTPASGLNIGAFYARMSSTAGQFQIGADAGWLLSRGAAASPRPTRAYFTNSDTHKYPVGAGLTWSGGSNGSILDTANPNFLPACAVTSPLTTEHQWCTLPQNSDVYGFVCTLRTALTSGQYVVDLMQGPSTVLLTCTLTSAARSSCSAWGPVTGGNGADLATYYRFTPSSPSSGAIPTCTMKWTPESW